MLRNKSAALLVAATLVGAGTAVASSAPSTAANGPGTEAQLINTDREWIALVQNSESKKVGKLISSDFQMTHGDQWTYGEPPLFAENREAYLKRIAIPNYYSCSALDNIQVELHKTSALTYGRNLVGFTANKGKPNAYFVIWYVHLYEKKGSKWLLASQRTVRGPHYGATPAEALEGTGPASSALVCPDVP